MRRQKLNEINVYDKKDTSYLIDKIKPLRLKDLNIEFQKEEPTKVISMRLLTELLNKVRAYAKQNDVSYTVMIKIMLAESIEAKYAGR